MCSSVIGYRKSFVSQGKQEGETERYSPEGGRRSQRALFARSRRDAPVRELGVSTGPPGRMCRRAGGQKWKKKKKIPQGLGETNHVTECNVTASGASVGGNKWMQTVSIKRRIDSRLKRVVPRFLPTPLLSAESTKWSRSRKRASHPQTSPDTKDFSYLPKLNAVVGYVHFPNDRKWLNKLLKSVLSKESWMFGFLP